MSEPTSPPTSPFGVSPPACCPKCQTNNWRFMGQYMAGFDLKSETLETGYECLTCNHREYIHTPIKPPCPPQHSSPAS